MLLVVKCSHNYIIILYMCSGIKSIEDFTLGTIEKMFQNTNLLAHLI